MAAMTKPQRWALGVVAGLAGQTLDVVRANGVNAGMVDRLAGLGLVFVQTGSRTVQITDQGTEADAVEPRVVFDSRTGRYVVEQD
jgi:hypothetical protein